MTPVLELVDLVKNFGSLRVTDRVSLELRPDECHALIGPNGAGKSTLINLVSGTLALEAGRVMLDGTDISDRSTPQRALAGLGRTFPDHLDRSEFLGSRKCRAGRPAKDGSSFRFFGVAAREEELNERARRALAALGLVTAGQGCPAAADLSHGERRLLELAIALVARAQGPVARRAHGRHGQGAKAKRADRNAARG